jgi:vacuolar protein sorting-associated protein 13A/C
LLSYISSDVVWETKPKKKARWKPMSIKHTEKLEREFKEYTESSPSEDKVIELDTNIPVKFLSTNVRFSFCIVILITTEF